MFGGEVPYPLFEFDYEFPRGEWLEKAECRGLDVNAFFPPNGVRPKLALKVTESKRKLHGLDAPRQLEISGQDGDEIKTDVGQILKDRLQALHDRYVESTSEDTEALTEAVETDQGINTAETPKNASESLKNASTEDNITDMEVDLAEKRSEIADRFEIVNGLKILRKNE